MNSATKPFATLSSGLLARKGAARPAMRPQGFGPSASSLDDLGWNDLGYEPPQPAAAAVRDADHDAFGEALPEPRLRNPIAALTPVLSPVHEQQATIAGRLVGNDPGSVEEAEDEDVLEQRWESAPLRLAATRLPAPGHEHRPAAEAPIEVQPLAESKKVAFTLRLDPARHLKLRLACAVTGRSAQQLLIAAADELLASMPGLDSMAERAPGASLRTSHKE